MLQSAGILWLLVLKGTGWTKCQGARLKLGIHKRLAYGHNIDYLEDIRAECSEPKDAFQ